MDNQHTEHAAASYGINIMVWLALVVLTALTVTVAGLNLLSFSIAAAVLIAAVKASLVVWYFMHVKYEPRIIGLFFMMAVFVLAIIISLTFLDVSFR